MIICDQEEKAASLLENKEKGVTTNLSCLVIFNDFSNAFVERARVCGVEVLKFTQVMVSRFKLVAILVVNSLLKNSRVVGFLRNWEERISKILW